MRSLFALGKLPRHPLNVGLDGPFIRFGHFKRFLPLPGMGPRILGRQACSLVTLPTELFLVAYEIYMFSSKQLLVSQPEWRTIACRPNAFWWLEFRKEIFKSELEKQWRQSITLVLFKKETYYRSVCVCVCVCVCVSEDGDAGCSCWCATACGVDNLTYCCVGWVSLYE
jgi:hypothetical protein